MATIFTIGDRLRRARRAKDLVQGDVAQAIGVSQATVSDIDCGRRVSMLRTHVAYPDAAGHLQREGEDLGHAVRHLAVQRLVVRRRPARGRAARTLDARRLHREQEHLSLADSRRRAADDSGADHAAQRHAVVALRHARGVKAMKTNKPRIEDDAGPNTIPVRCDVCKRVYLWRIDRPSTMVCQICVELDEPPPPKKRAA